jgi:hypothetical protein
MKRLGCNIFFVAFLFILYCARHKALDDGQTFAKRPGTFETATAQTKVNKHRLLFASASGVV